LAMLKPTIMTLDFSPDSLAVSILRK